MQKQPNLGQRTFAPGLLPTVAAIALVLLFCALGNWQLRRADEASALQAAMTARQHTPPIDLNRFAAAEDKWPAVLWRPAVAHGKWDSQQQVLLDNQTLGGRVGYFVFTPLLIDRCACALLVNRGWIAAPPDRRSIPEIGIAAKKVTISGLLAPAPPSGVGVRNDTERLASGLLRVQRLDLTTIPTDPGVRLLPLTLRLDPAAPDGYERKWHQPGMRADRHTAYAVQWFLFALITAGLYLWLGLRPRLHGY